MKRYQNRHEGQTCLIIGNGPSLANTPLDLLRHYPSFGTNRIFLLKGFNPTYYVTVDPYSIDGSLEYIRRMTCAQKFVKFPYSLEVPGSVPLKRLTAQMFSFDPEQGINEGWTVTYACMQLA